MSQHLQHHHQQQAQPQYVHYAGPPVAQIHPQVIHHQTSNVAPQQQQQQQQIHQQQPQPQHQSQQHHQPQQTQHTATPQVSQATQPGAQQPQHNGAAAPLVATGDWTRDLVHLAKTAELKKHALTLQLQTAHILSAHATLEQKKKIIQDIKEQKNKLESERMRLLQCLAQVNEDRDKADLQQNQIEKECRELQAKIDQLTEGDYAMAKRDVDRLRQELGQPPVPTLQATLEEKTAQYLNERRLNGSEAQQNPTPVKRASETSALIEGQPTPGKRPRGRPKGSKNRAKVPTSTPGPSVAPATAGSTAT